MEGFDYYLQAFRKYFDFEGRARRSEYWYFVLFNILAYILIISLAFVIKGAMLIVIALYAMFSFIPSLALNVRRLHDTNRSGAFILLHFVPLGGLVLFIFFLESGTQGPNKFGEDPKLVDDQDSYV